MASLIKNRINIPANTRPSFRGHNVLITGANAGLGFETALKCVQQDADQVIFAVRSLEKGEAARKAIEERTGRTGCVQVWPLDMLDYGSLTAFVARVEKELPRLDYVVLNAGVAALRRETSSYGFERILQVNVLSTTLLALLLLPRMRASRREDFTPTLEIVGSIMHTYLTKLLPDVERAERGGGVSAVEVYNREKNFDSMNTYAVSKLFVMYAQTGIIEHFPWLSKPHPDVNFVVVCPGACVSDLARDFSAWYFSPLKGIFRLIQRTTEQGARTYVSGLTLGEKGHGRFWQSDEIQPPAPLLAGKNNKALQERVWDDIVAALRKDYTEVDHLLVK